MRDIERCFSYHNIRHIFCTAVPVEEGGLKTQNWGLFFLVRARAVMVDLHAHVDDAVAELDSSPEPTPNFEQTRS